MAKENKDDHGQAPTNPNPLANLDEETQQKIQQLQMMEQSFQQLLMQKNAFSMEATETDFIIKEVEKTKGEVSRIIGNQVVIKATKEEILEDMKNKKKLIDTRMKSIDEQEKEFSQKIEEIRKEVMEKIQG
ncbi:prefoldin subunit [archaeon]|nr:prefoldin subunit [archaeon]